MDRSVRVASLLVCSVILKGSEFPAPVFMPVPRVWKAGQGSLPIDSTFRVRLTGYSEPRLKRAVVRLQERIESEIGIALQERAPAADRASLTISCEHAGKPVQELGEDESYQLSVTAQGATLRAAQPLGVLRGLETFLQTIAPGASGFEAAAVEIEDAPRFPWRGLSFDVARHFMPVDEVKRTLDGMGAVKMNVFHWHLSDNQGFRVESRRFPKLQTLGSNGEFYTQEQVREVIEYARDRGIRVIPEFDIPGHATAMLVAYPELATAPAPREIDKDFGVLDPVMDPSKEAVYAFLDGFIGEMAELFPDRFFHIGGDEVNGKLWNQSAGVSAFKKAHEMTGRPGDPDGNHALQAMFNRRVHGLVEKHGKYMEGWDEILNPDLPRTILIQSWRGQKSLADAARLGYRGILSSGYYLDLCFPAADHYKVDPLGAEADSLTPEQQKLVLGGEAAMWSEWVTPETMDSRVWPRAAAIAERLWSPAGVRNADDMYRRLEVESARLDRLGLHHLSWQRPMLERLAGNADPHPLFVLGEALEPVKEYEREKYGPYTTETPFIRMVDAIAPESVTARRLGREVDEALAGQGSWLPVKIQLETWKRNDIFIAKMAESDAMITDAAQMSSELARICGIGLEAISYVETGRKIPENWRAQNLTLLNQRHVAGALEIAVVDAVKRIFTQNGKQ